MRTTLAVISALVGSCLLVACGGSGSGGSGGASPGVAGQIVKRNGSTTNLSGVHVACTENGSADVSDGSGSFSIHIPHGTVIHLDVTDTAASGGDKGDGGASKDLSDNQVEVGEVGDGESCDIEIEIEDGQVTVVHMSKHDGKGGHEDSGEGALLPTTDGSTAFAEVKAGGDGDCLRLAIEARGLAPSASYDVTLVDSAGATLALGTLATSEHGEAALVFEACGADLPFGVASVQDLAGATIVVKDSGGADVLTGDFPLPGANESDGEGDGGDKGGDGGDKGGDTGGDKGGDTGGDGEGQHKD